LDKTDGLRDYIYKYGYLYQITEEDQWANLAIKAMEKFPVSLEAYGGANNGYGYALEGLAIGFDWCHKIIQELDKTEHFVSLINEYYIGNRKNLDNLPDFHNYSGQAEIAMLLAGLATYGENTEAPRYISEARNIMEHGETRNGIYYNVKDSIAFVGGACNWEGVTYLRKPLFSYIKYIEAIRTASQEKINLWEDSIFSSIENAGYYIIYSLRSDKLFENIGDVNYRDLSYFDINNLAALQSTFKNPYFTSFLNKNVKWKKSKRDKGIWPGHYRAPLIFYLMWYDPDLPEANLDELPLSKKFGDVIIIRNGFGQNDTHITFKSGFHYGLHTQLDHGAFTIFKNSPLAIDSGYYSSWKWGKQHIWNYWKRTIAHNSLLIYNPEEKPFTYPRNNRRKIINDGGQRFPFMRHFPPHSLAAIGTSHHPKSVDYIKKKSDEYSMGIITEYESQDNYVYISTDLTNAYNNSYSGLGTNPPKRVNSVERQFLYLTSDHIVIYDKIDAISKKFEKTWLLHSGSYYDNTNKPELNGTLKLLEGSYEAGITESLDSNTFKIKNGDSQLLVKTLMPLKHKTRRIGGTDYEFWVRGENQPITGKIPEYRKIEDPGAWRIEINPIEQKKYHEFLHVLIPRYKNPIPPPQIDKLEVEPQNTIGVQIKDEKNNRILVFSKLKQSPSGSIKYAYNKSTLSHHIITGVMPEKYYTYNQINSEGVHTIVIQKSNTHSGILSSSEGILLFNIESIKNK
jgi:hypothetical protein